MSTKSLLLYKYIIYSNQSELLVTQKYGLCKRRISTNLPGILGKSTGTSKLTRFYLVKPFLKHQFNLTLTIEGKIEFKERKQIK